MGLWRVGGGGCVASGQGQQYDQIITGIGISRLEVCSHYADRRLYFTICHQVTSIGRNTGPGVKMKIRAATKADLGEVFRLELGAFGEHGYPDFFIRQAMDLWPGTLLVADVEGELVGYALGGMGEAEGRGWVLSLAVDEQRRGLGIGKVLLQRLCRDLEGSGCSELRLTVHPDNTAVGLYRTLGFELETSEPDYFGPGEPRQVLLRRG
jgi:[ribosomal protein S18]-alanine N-acetyltransferase